MKTKNCLLLCLIMFIYTITLNIIADAFNILQDKFIIRACIITIIAMVFYMPTVLIYTNHVNKKNDK
jgi:hypothetical protein